MLACAVREPAPRRCSRLSAPKASTRQRLIQSLRGIVGSVMEEAVDSGNTRADNPQLVAAREAALEATRKSLRLQREFYR